MEPALGEMRVGIGRWGLGRWSKNPRGDESTNVAYSQVSSWKPLINLYEVMQVRHSHSTHFNAVFYPRLHSFPPLGAKLLRTLVIRAFNKGVVITLVARKRFVVK